MKHVEVNNRKNQKDSWWRRALQIAIIIMATSCGFILRVNFLERSKL
jgi:hypothetical protein